MRAKWFGPLLLASTAILAGMLLQGCRNEPPLCAVCEREIHPATKAVLTVGRKTETTCCIACGMHFKSTHPEAAFQTVTDFKSGRDLKPADAVYLYGSDIQTCGGDSQVVRTGDSVSYVAYDRCQPAVLAFANPQDATGVQDQHGGKVVTMAQLQDLFKLQGNHAHH